MNWNLIRQIKRPFKVRFYGFDQYPIIYDCLEDKMTCCGNCQQCPLFIEYGKINCKEEIRNFIDTSINLPSTYQLKCSCPETIDETLYI